MLSCELFPFAKRGFNPRLEDLSEEQRRALPEGSEVVNIEIHLVEYFGEEFEELHVWLLGCRKSLVWRNKGRGRGANLRPSARWE